MPGQFEAEGDDESHAPTHRDFHHPYTPYTIQETFMSTVYQVLEEGKVGILESPTGTGKSLSLICGSLTWLRDHKRKTFEEGLNWEQDDSNDPAWLIEQTRARKRREMLRTREDLEARLAKVRTKEKAQLDRYLKGEKANKRRKQYLDPAESQDDEDQFVLEDYDSDAEQKSRGDGEYSAATLELMAKLGMGPAARDEDEEIEEEMKIYFCSRTHSQLSQFINELRRVNLPTAIRDEATPKEQITETVRHVTLGSRKNLCINPRVNRFSSVTAINERCAEIQKSGTAGEHKCQFLPNKENQPLVHDFRDHALASLRDIEDMGALGKEIGICPYYASRAAIKPAEMVTLPYPLMLQKSAREALGINLKGHVIIVDEAHNLMDAIAGIHGVEVSLVQLKTARAQLGGYLQKFRNRLKGKNRVYIAQVVRMVDSLTSYLETKLSLPQTDGVVIEKELLAGKGVDQINLFKLIRYLEESKLARKVEGYATYTVTLTADPKKSKQPSQPDPEGSTTPVLHHLSSLLSALTHSTNEGRLFFSKLSSTPDPNNSNITLKFLLLDPSAHFKEIVKEARAVILAGGTMSPFADYTSHLFPYLSPSNILTLSCGHVIPKSNLIAWNLSKGPTGKDLEFKFKNRGNAEMVNELGRALLNICTIIPDGVVVFFPSYNYLTSIVSAWSNAARPGETPILPRLEAKKPIFTEKKETSVESVLTAYARSIDTGKGGLLLSVVGGKMSEGINFSDALGRCVVIVGLPFPNINTAEWKAKIEYIESNAIERLTGSSSMNGKPLGKQEIEKQGKEEGRQFYENTCMRAVNQSVGRAIRHKGDYAAIVMVDCRYERENIKGKLPGWIREGLVEGSGGKNFGQFMGAVGGFFRRRKEDAS
ncbi:helicase C-terminal domain-containing protein [Tricladium varicosporioides]|nr:helicase C-terminal domain-containing protein [Hymenoscyphus varicosporioides]